MNYNWIPLQGIFQKTKGKIVFKGEEKVYGKEPDSQKGPAIGHYVSNQKFNEGNIQADVEFMDASTSHACEIMLYFNENLFINAGIGNDRRGMFMIRYWDRNKWIVLSSSGDIQNLTTKSKYSLNVSVSGSRIALSVNGVDVCTADLPINLPPGQPGLWCLGKKDLYITNYKVNSSAPKVFVVMQFSSPYDELYSDVIKKICEDEFKLKIERADETFKPGLIVADISKKIRESQIVIAEITPLNANVYYEVGFAHALNKPTILIADRDTTLPFDVSPFRTLYYENSIGGKSKIEEGLRKYLSSILKREPKFT